MPISRTTVVLKIWGTTNTITPTRQTTNLLLFLPNLFYEAGYTIDCSTLGLLVSCFDRTSWLICPAMSSSSHSPSPSSEGSAFPWILDHILTYPSSYEIPLRTMYTLNSAPRAQPLPHSLSRSGTPIPPTGFGANPSPTTTQFPHDQQHQAAAEAATAHFKACLMTQISQLPSQPCSLPPSFITSFVRRCFSFDIATVEFAQALTALDYLRDLETRRRREIASALRRLGIDPSTLGKEGDEISKKYPGVVSWVKAIEDKERKVEALYTQVYIGLRRWVRHGFARDQRSCANGGVFCRP